MGFNERSSLQVLPLHRVQEGEVWTPGRGAVHLPFIWKVKGSREPWKLIGSELFLKTLLLEKRWIGEQEEAWRQRAYPGGRGG